MNKTGFLAVIFLSITLINSFPLWEKAYPGSGQGNIHWGNNIAQRKDGNFYVVCEYYQTTKVCSNLLLIDSLGDTIWSKKFDSYPYFSVRDMVLFPDQSVRLLAAWSNNIDSNETSVFHIGSDGTIISSKVVPNPYPERGQEGMSMTLNTHGELDIVCWPVMGGQFSTVRRIDTLGNSTWFTTIGNGKANGALVDTGHLVFHAISTHINEIMVHGCLYNEDMVVDTGAGASFVYKIDSTGKLKWFNTFGINGIEDDAIAGIECANGEFVFVGHQHTKSYVFRLDGSGNIVWQHTFLEKSNAVTVLELPDNSLLVAGNYSVRGSNVCDIYLLHLSAKGDSLGCNIINSNGGTLAVHNIITPREGGLLMICNTGATQEGIILLRTDMSGNFKIQTPISQHFGSTFKSEHCQLILNSNISIIKNLTTNSTKDKSLVLELFGIDGSLISRIKSNATGEKYCFNLPSTKVANGFVLAVVKNINNSIIFSKRIILNDQN